MPYPQLNQPLNGAECDQVNNVLSRFQNEHAINNLEEIDGFFAALICSPDAARPSEYLPEIWGGEMAAEEAFANGDQLQEFLNLLFRHWNSIVYVLREGEVFLPLLLQDQDGIAHANDWARGFMRGILLHQQSWAELFKSEEHGGALIPILILAHEHDPDDQMRPYNEPIDVAARDRLIVGVAAVVSAIYRYFAPHRQRAAAICAAEATPHYRTERKIGRNDPCLCGSGKKYKHCCGSTNLP
jgi:uncharacterized protein